jgi:hypothetical protein
LDFSITVLIRQKSLGFIWLYTSVYGPTTPNLRNIFWRELSNIRQYSDVSWLIGGDFNVVRNRNERKGRTFNHSVSVKFNSFINSNNLIDLKVSDRKFTWSNMRDNPSFACLDRFLCIIPWRENIQTA